MTISTWRERARQHIATVIAAAHERGLMSPTDVERIVRSAYPFGPRINYPYRVWCEEVRAALHMQTTTTEHEQLRAWNAGEPIRAGSWEWPMTEENDHDR